MDDGRLHLDDLDGADAAAADRDLGSAGIRAPDLQLHHHGEERVLADDVSVDLRIRLPISVDRDRIRSHLLSSQVHRRSGQKSR